MQRNSRIYDNFIVFILSHENPDYVITLKSLKRHGYTGNWAIVLDDEDTTIDQYKKNFGDDKVLTFSKQEVAGQFDEFGKNLGSRCAVVYARNACFRLAKELGFTYFMELDDDYREFNFRYDEDGILKTLAPTNLDLVFDALLDYYVSCPQMKTLAMAQNGDFLGGIDSSKFKKKFLRKAMNSFICSTERPFTFVGRLNEDVNTYCTLGSRGELLCTVVDVNINQKETQQKNGRGMSASYVNGTYTKSFYSVICCPSFVKIGIVDNNHARIHHNIDWNHAVPKIISSRFKKKEEDV